MQNNIYIAKKFIKTKTYLFIIALCIISGFFFFIMNGNESNIFEKYYTCIANIWSVIGILLLTLIITNRFISATKDNTNYILRFKNKSDLIKNIFQIIVILNTIILLLYYFLPFIILILSGRDLSITLIPGYPNVIVPVYLIFALLKNILIINLMNLLYCVLNLIDKRAGVIYYALLIYIAFAPLHLKINTFTIDPSNYLVGLSCSSFLLEISYTVTYISIFYIIILLIYKLYLILKIDNVQ